MTNDVKTVLTTNLEETIVNIANTINTIALQGYVVNNAKYCSLNNAILVHILLKDYSSFDKLRKKEIENLYNIL